jgi:hypothetical protein
MAQSGVGMIRQRCLTWRRTEPTAVLPGVAVAAPPAPMKELIHPAYSEK